MKRMFQRTLLLLLLLLPAVPASAAADMAGHKMDGAAPMANGDHSAHEKAMADPGLDRSVHPYRIPDVVLVDQRGDEVRLTELLDAPKPVLVNFLYATCTTICPVLAAGFADFQNAMGERAGDARLVSITIDPEHDTPEVLAEYAERFGARADWSFLTGSRADIDRVMRAFDAYVENKMSHQPLTFLKAAGSGDWVRVNGLMGTETMMGEYRKVTGE